MKPAQPIKNSSEVKISFYKKLCRKKWFRIAKPLIIIGLVVLVVYILFLVGIFQIKKIETKDELKYSTHIEETTEQYLGQEYFTLNLENLENDILNSEKYVKEVSAEKIFPNKVFLEVEEYTPRSYLEYKEKCYIFSEEGVILEDSEEYEECVLNNGIELLSKENIIAENRLIFDTELYQIVKILEEFGWEVSTINFERNVLFVSDQEHTVVIEINQEYENQLSKLYLVLEKVNIEGMEYKTLDLRYQRPVMELL